MSGHDSKPAAKRQRTGDGDKNLPAEDVMKMMRNMQENMLSMQGEMNLMRESMCQMERKTRKCEEEMNLMQERMNEMGRKSRKCEEELSLMRQNVYDMERKTMKYERLERQQRTKLLGLTATTMAMVQDGANSITDLESKHEESEKLIKAKLRFHKQLIDNQRWQYSAKPPDASSWIENDYEDDEIENFSQMISNMKESATKMRQGEHFYCGFGVGWQNNDGDEFADNKHTLPFDPELLDHWKEWSNALSQYRYYLNQCDCGNAFSVYLTNVELTPKVLDMVGKALKNTGFRELCLNYNDSWRHLVSFVAKALGENEQCEELSLEGNLFESNTENEVLLVKVSNHPTLRNLKMKSCFGDSSNLLGVALPYFKNITIMDLSSNEITGNAATSLANFLETNPCLIDLELNYNPINDNDAAEIARGLASNTKLRRIEMEIGCNVMTEVGAKALRRTLYGDVQSLNSIAGSNHICEVRSDWPHTHCNSCRFDAKANRQWKMYDSLVYYLKKADLNLVDLIRRDLPIDGILSAKKLMPMVLETVQRCGDLKRRGGLKCFKTDPASIVYEIMKGWWILGCGDFTN